MSKRFLPINLDQIEIDMMKAKGFLVNEPEEVIQELVQIQGPAICPKDSKDLRDLTWFSIDNEDSMDLDQLTYAEAISGGVKLFVAIADVDAVVKKESAIDLFARTNTTSIYTPTRVFSMLPPKLSYGLTSLNQGEERCAMVVEMEISNEGELHSYSLYPACVRNHLKLTYPAVARFLEKKEAGDWGKKITEQLLLQDMMAQKIQKFRHIHGALSFETIELRPMITVEGKIELDVWRKNRATSIIENCMIAANEATTRFLAERNFPTFRRIVKTPEKWDRIVALVGENLPTTPDSHALEAVLMKKKQENPETFPDFCLALIKLLGRGEYEAHFPGEPQTGHFALAVQDYSHSTAPNRRYPDLITQRLLKASLQNLPCPYSKDELKDLAEHCSAKEVDAEKVERQTKKCAAALALSHSVGQHFPALVTGAGIKGTWVRILHPPVEGKLINHAGHLQVGDRVRVRLSFVDPAKGYIDFSLANP